jgi:hypothetical protein
MQYQLMAGRVSSAAESQEKDRKKGTPDYLAMLNPFKFLRLFSSSTMGTLCVVLGLQDTGNFANIYDMQNVFFYKSLNAKPSEVGNFATALGVTQVGELRFCGLWKLPRYWATFMS